MKTKMPQNPYGNWGFLLLGFESFVVIVLMSRVFKTCTKMLLCSGVYF
jgi:hypothetical protein